MIIADWASSRSEGGGKGNKVEDKSLIFDMRDMRATRTISRV